MKLNILVIGSGGREHALGWKIKQSKKLNKIFFAPGNAGTSELGENINIEVSDFKSIKQAIIKNNINLVLIGPEIPLVEGLHDFILADEKIKHIKVVGPQKEAAKLEGSKDYAKEFMVRHDIPTAKYLTTTTENINDGIHFLTTLKPPYVLKADGLAAGKGVLIIENLNEAQNALKKMLDGQFGEASSKVVIEEFLSGIELSVFAITDGKNYQILPEAKDYKRIGEGDTGLNTGGMGAISPVPFADAEFMKKVEDRVVRPTIEGLKKDSIPYNGFVFFGLINCGGNPYVIEYNVRMGDPETESVMLRIKSDFVDLLLAATDGTMENQKIEIDERTAVNVVLVSEGYPGNYKNGIEISGLKNVKNSIVFHAGTNKINNKILTNGGRVLAISSYGTSIKNALNKSYASAEKINYDGKYDRRDLGFDL